MDDKNIVFMLCYNAIKHIFHEDKKIISKFIVFQQMRLFNGYQNGKVPIKKSPLLMI